VKDIPNVKVGQVWADNDKRQRGLRTLEVRKVSAGKAVCSVLIDGMYSRNTTISIQRFQPNSTGYRLVSEAP